MTLQSILDEVIRRNPDLNRIDLEEFRSAYRTLSCISRRMRSKHATIGQIAHEVSRIEARRVGSNTVLAAALALGFRTKRFTFGVPVIFADISELRSLEQSSETERSA